MKRLSKDEREIRASRGISFGRWWPFAAILLAVGAASVDLSMLQRCTGKLLDGGGRSGTLLRAVLAYPCSPFLLRGQFTEWLLFGALWGSIPFALVNGLWVKRHKGYWDQVRLSERERRAAKRKIANTPPDPD